MFRNVISANRTTRRVELLPLRAEECRVELHEIQIRKCFVCAGGKELINAGINAIHLRPEQHDTSWWEVVGDNDLGVVTFVV